MASGNEPTNADLLEMMSKLMVKVDSLSERMSHVEKEVSHIKGHLADHATNSTTYTIVEQAQQKLASVVCFNNPYNIVFYGIPARRDMSLDETFRHFMIHMLHIDQSRANDMPICVQQMGRMSQHDANPPMCVSFISINDVGIVQARASTNAKVLEQSGIRARWSQYGRQGILMLIKNGK